MRKALIPVGVLAAVASLLFAGTASQANAATALSTCFESTCTGHPAASYTCVNDAEVIYSINLMHGSAVVGNIQLKYSPTCRATWARVISNLGFTSYAQIKGVQHPGTLNADCFGGITPGTGCNTNMIQDGSPTETLTSTAHGLVYFDQNGDSVDATTPAF